MGRYISEEHLKILREIAGENRIILSKLEYHERGDFEFMFIGKERRFLWPRRFGWVEIHPQGRLFEQIQVRTYLTKRNMRESEQNYQILKSIFDRFMERSKIGSYVFESPLEGLL